MRLIKETYNKESELHSVDEGIQRGAKLYWCGGFYYLNAKYMYIKKYTVYYNKYYL